MVLKANTTEVDTCTNNYLSVDLRSTIDKITARDCFVPGGNAVRRDL